MNLKFKKLHENAVLPKHAKHGDAGMDLTAISIEYKKDQLFHKYGISVEIPEGHVGLLFPRSSICKVSERLSNSVGVIDSSYRGEIMAVFDLQNDNDKPVYYRGERSAQLVIVPYVNCTTEWANDLSETERGIGSYGSTGN